MMIKNKKGSIINISSNAAVECDVGRSAYASSKAALIAFTKVLSKELGAFNIRTNSIAPGLTNTEMMVKDISKNKKNSLRALQNISFLLRSNKTTVNLKVNT